jgi:hypothetical protein
VYSPPRVHPMLQRAARVGPAAALIAIAVWSTCRMTGAQAPDDAAWQRAAARVRQEHQPGELIVFAPAWADPIGRLHLGDLLPIEMAGRLDGARYGVIWELSIRGARAPETRGLRPTMTTSTGGVTVRRYQRPAIEVLYDFAPQIAAATVAGARSRGPELVLAEVGFDPHRCAQIVPEAGKSATLTFAGVPLGSSLAIGAGLADVFTRRDVRAPGELAVAVDGRPVATLRFGVDDGWVRKTVATTPGTATVAFTATAVGPKSPNRLICFAAEARR